MSAAARQDGDERDDLAQVLAALRLVPVAAMGGRTLRSASVAAADPGVRCGLRGAVLLHPPDEIDFDGVAAELHAFFGARADAGPPLMWSPWRLPLDRRRRSRTRSLLRPVSGAFGRPDHPFDVGEVVDDVALAAWMSAHRRGCRRPPEDRWLDAMALSDGSLRLFIASSDDGRAVATAATFVGPAARLAVVDFVTRVPGTPPSATAAVMARAADAAEGVTVIAVSDGEVMPGWVPYGQLHGAHWDGSQVDQVVGGTGR